MFVVAIAKQEYWKLRAFDTKTPMEAITQDYLSKSTKNQPNINLKSKANIIIAISKSIEREFLPLMERPSKYPNSSQLTL